MDPQETDIARLVGNLGNRLGAETRMLEKRDESATATRWPKPERSARLNVLGKRPVRMHYAAPRWHSNTPRRLEGSGTPQAGRVRCRLGGVSGWIERMGRGSGFAEQVDRHRRIRRTSAA